MYVKMISFGGLDWHDERTKIMQLKWENRFDIPEDKVIACIVNDIIEGMPYLNPKDIYNAVSKNQPCRFPIIDLKDGKNTAPGALDFESCDAFGEVKGFYYYTEFLNGQVCFQNDYEVYDIPQDRVCYIAEEHFYAYVEGVPLVERFYHEPFHELKDAEAYLEKMNRHHPDSTLSIQVYDLKQISSTDWFKSNMKAITLSSEDTEKGYDVFVSSHIENLKKLMQDGTSANPAKQ